MNTPEKEINREAAMFQTMAVLSTLMTALEVRYRTAERQAGRDPSDQEPGDVAAVRLREAVADLEQMLVRLSASGIHAAGREEDALTAAVRRFDDLMTVNRAGVLLQSIHQRLLSLYPSVTEALAEEARLVYAGCRELLDAEDVVYSGRLAGLVDRGFRLGLWIERELLAATR